MTIGSQLWTSTENAHREVGTVPGDLGGVTSQIAGVAVRFADWQNEKISYASDAGGCLLDGDVVVDPLKDMGLYARGGSCVSCGKALWT